MAEQRPLYMDGDSARRLTRTSTHASRLPGKEKPFRGLGSPVINRSVVVQVPSEGIAARSGLTISSAECTIFNVVNGVFVDTTRKIDVYNMMETAIGGDAYVLAELERGGDYIVKAAEQTVGTFRVTFVADFTTSDSTVSCSVDKTDFGNLSGTVTANNLMQLESDQGYYGYCHLYADGTIDLIAAQCPEGT